MREVFRVTIEGPAGSVGVEGGDLDDVLVHARAAFDTLVEERDRRLDEQIANLSGVLTIGVSDQPIGRVTEVNDDGTVTVDMGPTARDEVLEDEHLSRRK